MILLIYKNGSTYSFALKNAEREMDFCIDVSQAHSGGAIKKFQGDKHIRHNSYYFFRGSKVMPIFF